MMAVPFVLPEDEINNLIAAVIFILSQTRLQRAEENHQLRVSAVFNSSVREPVQGLGDEPRRIVDLLLGAVSSSPSFRFRVGQRMEELVRLLVEELDRRSRSFEYDNQLRQTLFLLRQTLNQFPPAPRGSSKSCCYDAVKCSPEVEDCSQVGLVLRKIPDDDEPSAIFKLSEGSKEKTEFAEETLFSRLVPG
ncbi:uncharacterized protein BDFB_007740, partial [Asbolus verrucosus]